MGRFRQREQRMSNLFLRRRPKYSMYGYTGKTAETRVEYGAPDTIRTCDRLVRSQIVTERNRLNIRAILFRRFYAIQWFWGQCYQTVTRYFYAPGGR